MGRLKDLRCNRGLTQERLADEIGTSQQTISRIEGKGDMIPVDLLVRLSKYYNVSVDYLLGLSDEKYNQASRDRISYYMEKYDVEFAKYDVLNPEYQEIVKSVIYTLSELQEKQAKEKRGA
ncbi:MAG: helix-turn-helix transcriptional regulator [Lachnospiraceae bacterium]|nr:helix-turn-helix transcriptional regulator [Lachnospiraceae bacterium]